MHAKPNNKNHRRVFIAGSAALLVVIAILVAVLIGSQSGGKFDKYYKQGADAYAAGEYSYAAESLEKALEYGDSVDCYVLLANTYYAGLGDIDKAMEVLYVGSYKLESDTINSYLDSLKAIKAEGDSVADAVTIGGETISPDVTSLVLSQMRLQDSDILPLTQLTKLESLSLTDNGLTDISPLAGLTELSFLQLGNNQVSDISPLAGLSKLKTLYLDGNPIDDFTPLHSLKSLTTLSLKNTGITEEEAEALEEALPNCSIHCERGESDEVEELTLGGVTFMSDVTELDLSGKNITDISILAKCTNLQKLDLRDNKISDITPLMDLSELSWLCIWNNDVEDILPLMGLAKLEYLDADGNEIEDITAVSALTSLRELWLSYNDIDSFEPLEKLTQLERLGLKGTGLEDSDLASLKKLKNLTELALEDNAALSGGEVDKLKSALSGCNITHSELKYFANLGGTQFDSDDTAVSATGSSVTNLTGLDHFSKLTTLQLTNTSVTNLSPIAELENLQILEVWSSDASKHGALSDLTPLKNLTSLTQLNLMFNSITDISALSGLTNLRELHLDGNSLSGISALSGMSSLESLSLQGCGISDISALSGLTNLRELYLEDNSISNVEALKGLTKLSALYISNNSVTAEQLRELKAALPGCTIYTELDLSEPVEETPDLSSPELAASAFGMTDAFTLMSTEETGE